MEQKEILELDHPRAWRTYVGGERLNAILGQELDSHFPEEWIMSVIQARNVGREEYIEGLSSLREYPNISLRSVLHKEPEWYLGKTHYSRYGESLGVLVKLIDSNERLTVQVHPTRTISEKLFHSPYGKTESWYILNDETREEICPVVYLGFREGVTRERWEEVFHRQDIPAMLSMMHCFQVKKGDMILIEGGVPHAIGAGCFLAEVQEPTDYTIRTERVTPNGLQMKDEACHQNLGFKRMFDCFTYEGVSEEEARKRWFIQPKKLDAYRTQLIGTPEIAFFSLYELEIVRKTVIPEELSFYGVYILEGNGILVTGHEQIKYQAPAQFFVSASAGKVEVRPEKMTRMLQFFGPM